MTTRLQAEQALSRLMRTTESYRQFWTALMGDGSGVIQDPDDPDRCFVRVHGLQNSVASVFNKAVPTSRNDLPVLIGTTRLQPHLVQVLQVDWSALPEWGGVTLLPEHGPDHELPDGCDPVYIQKRAIVPLRASAQTTPDMTLYVADDFYPYEDNFVYFPGGNTEDMTARVPAGGTARFVLVYIDPETNALAYINGETVGLAWPLGVDAIPVPPENSVPICAARLTTTTTSITEGDIYDLRILNAPMSRAGGPVHALDPKGGQHTGQLDTSYLWASVACCGAQ